MLVTVAHTFNHSVQEVKAERSLSSRPACITKSDPVSKKKRKKKKKEREKERKKKEKKNERYLMTKNGQSSLIIQ